MTEKRMKLKYSFYQVGDHFKLKQFPTTNEKHLHKETKKNSNISQIIIIITWGRKYKKEPLWVFWEQN